MTSARLFRQRLQKLEAEIAIARANVVGENGQVIDINALAAQVTVLTARLDAHEALKKHP